MRMTRRWGPVLAVLLATAFCVVPDASPVTRVAPAADSMLFVSFTLDGKAVLGKLGSAVVLNPGTFDATIDLTTGALTGTITLPPAAGTFLAFGFMPVGATTSFTEQGTAGGTYNGGIADVTAYIVLGLSKTTVNGTALDAGACATAQPVVVHMTGPLSLVGSSELSAPFTIPLLRGCGTTEHLDQLFDGLVAGPGNTLDARLTLRCSGPACSP